VKEISTEELKSKINGGEKIFLVDTLDVSSFAAQHLPHSISLPYDLYFLEKFSQKITSEKEAEIIVYCASRDCKTSVLAGQVLEKAGYKNVRHYAGGLAGWQADGNEFESGYPNN
jgi:rhodanese-related sulfurtransferase